MSIHVEWTKVLEDVGPVMANRLENARHHVPGYETIAVPAKGFSEIDAVHNEVIDFCRRHSIHLFNPTNIAANLEATLPRKTRTRRSAAQDW